MVRGQMVAMMLSIAGSMSQVFVTFMFASWNVQNVLNNLRFFVRMGQPANPHANWVNPQTNLQVPTRTSNASNTSKLSNVSNFSSFKTLKGSSNSNIALSSHFDTLKVWSSKVWKFEQFESLKVWNLWQFERLIFWRFESSKRLTSSKVWKVWTFER